MRGNTNVEITLIAVRWGACHSTRIYPIITSRAAGKRIHSFAWNEEGVRCVTAMMIITSANHNQSSASPRNSYQDKDINIEFIPSFPTLQTTTNKQKSHGCQWQSTFSWECLLRRLMQTLIIKSHGNGGLAHRMSDHITACICDITNYQWKELWWIKHSNS